MFADFHVLARVKRKRDQQVSSGIGRYGSTLLSSGKSLGSFVQSALSEGGGGEEAGSLLVKGGPGGLSTGRVGGGRTTKKGSSQARKKLKLGQLSCCWYEWPGSLCGWVGTMILIHIAFVCVAGAREWMKLGAVRWPGFEEGEEDEDSAEIQVYSDSDSDQQEEVEGTQTTQSRPWNEAR